jgi:hypothetical protein
MSPVESHCQSARGSETTPLVRERRFVVQLWASNSTSDVTEMPPIICAPILHKYRPPHAIPSTTSRPQPCVPRRIESTTSHYGLCPQYHRSCLKVLGRSSVHKRGAVHVMVHTPPSSGYPHERDLLCVTRRCSHFRATENVPGLCIRTSKPSHLQC